MTKPDWNNPTSVDVSHVIGMYLLNAKSIEDAAQRLHFIKRRSEQEFVDMADMRMSWKLGVFDYPWPDDRKKRTKE